MSWRRNQQSKPWPWPGALYMEDVGEDNLNTRVNSTSSKYDNPEGQVLDGTVYKNAFPIPGNHYIYKSKKSFKDKYAKNKAKFDKKDKLPPITEAMSEVSSKAGSTRSTRSWMIPRYNPDILSDVMASDESDSEDDDYTSGRSERKYRKSGRRSNSQASSMRHVDVIRNVQAPRAQPKKYNIEVWPAEKNRNYYPNEINQNYNILHRSSMNGDAVLANQLMNNGSVYKEKHPMAISQTADDNRTMTNQNWNDNTYGRQNSFENDDISRKPSTNDHRRKGPKNNCLITCIIIVVIFSLLGAGIASYLLLRDSFDDAETVDTTSPTPRTTKFEISLHLAEGNFTAPLNDNTNLAFMTLEEEVCTFVESISLTPRLKIELCEVTSFREGSIVANLDLFIREDVITSLRASNSSLTSDASIARLIQDDINAAIDSGSVGGAFVEKYNPSAQMITHVFNTSTTTTMTTTTTITPPTTTMTMTMTSTTPTATTEEGQDSHISPSVTVMEESSSNQIETSTADMEETISSTGLDSTITSEDGGFSSSSLDFSPSSTDVNTEMQSVTSSVTF